MSALLRMNTVGNDLLCQRRRLCIDYLQQGGQRCIEIGHLRTTLARKLRDKAAVFQKNTVVPTGRGRFTCDFVIGRWLNERNARAGIVLLHRLDDMPVTVYISRENTGLIGPRVEVV